MDDPTDDTTSLPSLREGDSDDTTPPASDDDDDASLAATLLPHPPTEQYDNRLRDLVRGCTVEFRTANHAPWGSILVGDLVDQMPEPSYTTISTDPFMEVRFAGKVFRCEATDGVMTLAAMVHVLYALIEWVDDCMSTGFQGAPANWSYDQDEGRDHEPTRATSPPPRFSDPTPPPMGDPVDDTTPPTSLREDDDASPAAKLSPHPETTELPDHFPRHGDVNLAR